jgi:hypothetical protein
MGGEEGGRGGHGDTWVVDVLQSLGQPCEMLGLVQHHDAVLQHQRHTLVSARGITRINVNSGGATTSHRACTSSAAKWSLASAGLALTRVSLARQIVRVSTYMSIALASTCARAWSRCCQSPAQQRMVTAGVTACMSERGTGRGYLCLGNTQLAVVWHLVGSHKDRAVSSTRLHLLRSGDSMHTFMHTHMQALTHSHAHTYRYTHTY